MTKSGELLQVTPSLLLVIPPLLPHSHGNSKGFTSSLLLPDSSIKTENCMHTSIIQKFYIRLACVFPSFVFFVCNVYIYPTLPISYTKVSYFEDLFFHFSLKYRCICYNNFCYQIHLKRRKKITFFLYFIIRDKLIVIFNYIIY